MIHTLKDVYNFLTYLRCAQSKTSIYFITIQFLTLILTMSGGYDHFPEGILLFFNRYMFLSIEFILRYSKQINMNYIYLESAWKILYNDILFFSHCQISALKNQWVKYNLKQILDSCLSFALLAPYLKTKVKI